MVSVFVQYSCANTDDFEKYALIPGASKVICFQWVIEWRRGLFSVVFHKKSRICRLCCWWWCIVSVQRVFSFNTRKPHLFQHDQSSGTE